MAEVPFSFEAWESSIRDFTLLFNKVPIGCAIHYLLDVSTGVNSPAVKVRDHSQEIHPLRIYVFSSPNMEAKKGLTVSSFFMPTWELTELIDYAHVMRKTQILDELGIPATTSPEDKRKAIETEIEKRYVEFGGCPRKLFDRTFQLLNEYRSDIDGAVTSFEVKQTHVVGLPADHDRSRVVHRLFYLFVPQLVVNQRNQGYDFQSHFYGWASDNILGKCAEKMRDLLAKKSDDLFTSLETDPLPIRGQLYERIVHLILLNSNKAFPLRRLGTGSNSKTLFKDPSPGTINLTDMKSAPFRTDQVAQQINAALELKSNSYLRPSDNPQFPVVDSFIVLPSTSNTMIPVGVQITISSRHGKEAKSDLVPSLLNAILPLDKKERHFHLIFVPPPADEPKFDVQEIDLGVGITVHQYSLRLYDVSHRDKPKQKRASKKQGGNAPKKSKKGKSGSKKGKSGSKKGKGQKSEEEEEQEEGEEEEGVEEDE